MLSRSLLSCLLVTAFACGGRATADGGTGGQATGGSGGSAGQATEGISAYCELDTSLAPPYAITFTLTNNGSLPLYLLEGCELSHSILSCAEGYSRPLPASLGGCRGSECPADPALCHPPGACGACPFVPVLLESGDSYELSWNGLLYIDENRPPACSCYTLKNAQSGIYRIDVPVFATEPQPQSREPTFTVGQQFELPTPGNVVNVDLVGRL
jgi:hypothetical protein